MIGYSVPPAVLPFSVLSTISTNIGALSSSNGSSTPNAARVAMSRTGLHLLGARADFRNQSGAPLVSSPWHSTLIRVSQRGSPPQCKPTPLSLLPASHLLGRGIDTPLRVALA